MVDVGVGELRRSRERLAKQGEAAEQAGEDAVCGLLLFYAAECGLKAEVLRWVLHRQDTSALPSDLRTHDLRRLAKALNLKAPGPGPDPLRCRRHTDGTWLESHELHQAWRYGARLRADDQKAAVEALKALVNDAKKGS
ncbi:hypothetical protein AQ490_21325 [Wenjunlia vitaminophila]|uniref:HEPN domain-containing protein n=1 Tax=Wenjunlia vitaminophila TaxID=76728 RepID=A0A0T6LT02_WENVI|nr:hypothetical protein [Wenjunlia vitaminophila]KRV49152.1 hypothetical protein AQ490_21325 [Wenjunlia vitaminophila]